MIFGVSRVLEAVEKALAETYEAWSIVSFTYNHSKLGREEVEEVNVLVHVPGARLIDTTAVSLIIWRDRGYMVPVNPLTKAYIQPTETHRALAKQLGLRIMGPGRFAAEIASRFSSEIDRVVVCGE